MGKKVEVSKKKDHAVQKEIQSDLPGYPLYPVKEDIYNQSTKEEFTESEDPDSLYITSVAHGSGCNEKDFSEDLIGDDLDVPGAELDDQQESVGSEDEENNYYSIGGDDHSDLDETRGND
jgi:hypothetical protein